MKECDREAIPPPASGVAPSTVKVYRCGTLAYTKAGLFMLFSWLLWGDFCFVMMNQLIPTIMPLEFGALGASPVLISILISTLPAVLNFTGCPIVSFKSDRHRGRWGRRQPFIFFTMPFLVICLAMLGWSRR